ncbi:hypothetical protein EV426DRAFT_572604 [Tirmania nivea]|nr:hypothetical protein EV426DRAFT_572604 [Tirmania nivea]
MSAVHVQTVHYEQLRSPKLVLRSTNRAQSYRTASSVSYREPIHIRRYRDDCKTHCPESAHDYGHQHYPLSKLKGRLVPRSTRCGSDYDCDYGTPSNLSSPSHGIGYENSYSSSSSSLEAGGVDIFEVSPSRPGFVMSPGVSPGHALHHTEQQGYFSALPSRQHSPYNTIRSGVRFLSSVHGQDETWPEGIESGDEADGDRSEEEGELRDKNPDYWAEEEHTRHLEPGYAYAGQKSQLYHYEYNPPAASGPAPPRKTTTPTGTIRVNGEIVNAALPKRRTPTSVEHTPQSAFFGFNPTPRSQRAPSSTGTGTVLRRGLHRHQQRRHSEGDTDDHIHGPTQDECRQCNGEGCARSLAMKEFRRKMDQDGGMAGHPETWGPSVRELMGYNG